MPRQPKTQISGWQRHAKGGSSFALVRAGAQATNVSESATTPSSTPPFQSSWSSKASSSSETGRTVRAGAVIDPSLAHLKNIGAEDMDVNGVFRFNNRRDLQISMPSLVLTFESGGKPQNPHTSSNSLLTRKTNKATSLKGKTTSPIKSLADADPNDPTISYNAVSTASLLSARSLEAAYRQAVEHKQQVSARHPFSAPVQMSRPLVFLPHEESSVLVSRAESKAKQAAAIGYEPKKPEEARTLPLNETTSGSIHYTASQAQLLALPDTDGSKTDSLNKDGIRLLQHQLSRAKVAHLHQSSAQLNGQYPMTSSTRSLQEHAQGSDYHDYNMDYITAAVGSSAMAQSLSKRIRTRRIQSRRSGMEDIMSQSVNSDYAAFNQETLAARARAAAKRRAAELVQALEDEAYEQAEQAIQMREHERQTRINALGAIDVPKDGSMPISSEIDGIDDLARLAGLLEQD